MSEITSSLFQHYSHEVPGKFGEQIEVEEKKELAYKIRLREWQYSLFEKKAWHHHLSA